MKTGYNRCWAQDVITELGYDNRDINSVNWILRWMQRNWMEPEENSVTASSDLCKEDFLAYMNKRVVKENKT